MFLFLAIFVSTGLASNLSNPNSRNLQITIGLSAESTYVEVFQHDRIKDLIQKALQREVPFGTSAWVLHGNEILSDNNPIPPGEPSLSIVWKRNSDRIERGEIWNENITLFYDIHGTALCEIRHIFANLNGRRNKRLEEAVNIAIFNGLDRAIEHIGSICGNEIKRAFYFVKEGYLWRTPSQDIENEVEYIVKIFLQLQEETGFKREFDDLIWLMMAFGQIQVWKTQDIERNCLRKFCMLKPRENPYRRRNEQ